MMTPVANDGMHSSDNDEGSTSFDEDDSRSSSSISSSSSVGHSHDDDDDSSGSTDDTMEQQLSNHTHNDDDALDPVITPYTSSSSSSSFIFSSLAAATVMLRQRRHYRVFQEPTGLELHQHHSQHHHPQRTVLVGTLSSSATTRASFFSLRKYRRADRKDGACCAHGEQQQGPCGQLRRQWAFLCRNHCSNNNHNENHSSNNKNKNNNKYVKNSKTKKRKRTAHTITIHEIATYLLVICILIWFVVLLWNLWTYNDEYPSAPITTTRYQPLRERTRLGRPGRHGHQRDSWLVQLGLAINSFVLFGTSKQYTNLPADVRIKKDHVDSETLPRECQRAEWQSYNYPTCNDIMEIDLPNMVRIAPRKTYHDTGRLYDRDTGRHAPITTTIKNMGYVAQGYWRSVWAVHPPRRNVEEATAVVVLKTMRRSHELSTRNYDRHRRDAIVMEQLTSSPYVVDIYGFCGNSVMTEYMDLTLEDIAFDDSQYPIIDTDVGDKIVVTSDKRIQLALDMVRGVQAIHEIPGGPIVHADLQAKQFLISRQTGTVKINDFNRCRFMASKHSNRTTNVNTPTNMPLSLATTTNATTTATVPCKFRIPSAPGISRSPEEYRDDELDEKIDVYAVGHVLYNLLSYREAWDGYHSVTAQQRMMDGEIPNMDVFIQNSSDSNHTNPMHAMSDLPIHIQEWYINVTKQAYTFHPSERKSAAELAVELEAMLAVITAK